jgi:hypothetical protein
MSLLSSRLLFHSGLLLPYLQKLGDREDLRVINDQSALLAVSRLFVCVYTFKRGVLCLGNRGRIASYREKWQNTVDVSQDPRLHAVTVTVTLHCCEPLSLSPCCELLETFQNDLQHDQQSTVAPGTCFSSNVRLKSEHYLY